MSNDDQINNNNNSSVVVVSQEQIDEVRLRKEYYACHPNELISWEEAQKLIEDSIL